MAENKILSNINYNIRNYSNYDIVKEETKDIIDVPYFPAQNLVEVKQTLNVFRPTFDYIIPFYDEDNSEYYVSCLVNRTDARFLFINIHNDKRYIHYRFAGTHYPQGRSKYSISYNGKDKLIIAFGIAGERALQDIWLYEIKTNEWKLLNYSDIEKSINEMPSRRYNSSILLKDNTLLIFGGETDAYLTGENLEEKTFKIPLNDIWEYDILNNRFINYDKDRVLPRRIGNICYVDDSVIKILIVEGEDNLGNYQPTRIWIIDKTNDTVSHVDYTPPFSITPDNISLYLNGNFYILSDGKLYQFDNDNNSFTQVKDNIVGMWYNGYWFTIDYVKKHRGDDNPLMDKFDIMEVYIKKNDDTEYGTYTINLPPYGERLNKCYYDGGIFYYSGLIHGGQFDEYTYLFNRETYWTEKLTFPEDQRPTERFYASLCYDKYRNRIWLFGGYDGTKFYNDLWYFDLNTKQWVQVHDTLENLHDENPQYPPPRQKAGICVVAEDYLYIIGGYNDIEAFNDFWKYHIPTGKWEQEYPVDDIPWGTQYFIFEYKDRLWLFNGDPNCLYRYYYNKKMFVKQRIFNVYVNDSVKSKINKKEYLDPPIYVTKIGDYLFIYNSQINCRINLQDRVLLDFKREFNFESNILWIDWFYGFSEKYLYTYYINVSDLYPLTKNQLPLAAYHMKLSNQEIPIKTAFYTQYDTETDTKHVYIDRSGLFTIQKEKEYLDKLELLTNGEITPFLLQSNYLGQDLNDETTLTNILLDHVRKPWFVPQRPWFLYNKFSNMFKELKGAIDILKNPKEPHVSYIIYENGNICRFNHIDLTFYVYFTKIPPGCALLYDENNNYIYTFGGLFNDRPMYNQYGMKCSSSEVDMSDPNNPIEIEHGSHNGILKVDLNINQFNINKINDYLSRNNITRIDYEVVKNYILDELEDYLNYYANPTENINPEVMEYIRQKIYFNTHELIDDLSQLDVTHESGTRPSPRAFMQYWSIDDNLYLFGGGKFEKIKCSRFSIDLKYEPYSVLKPQQDNGTDDSKYIYKFDIKKQTWSIVGEFPEWLYYASAIPTPDKESVIIVGGYTQENWKGLSNKIWIYNLKSNTFEEFKGINYKFQPRAMPILHWIDENRLLIQYGFWSFMEQGKCKSIIPHYGSNIKYIVHFIPIMDAWICDFKNEVMYKVWEDFLPFGVHIHDFYSDDNERERKAYIFNPYPMLKGQNEEKPQTAKIDSTLKLLEINNINGEVNVINIIPSDELARDFNPLNKYGDKKVVDDGYLDGNSDTSGNYDNIFSNDSDINNNLLSAFLFGKLLDQSNFRFRYGWLEKIEGKKLLFIVGERCEDSGIEFIKQMKDGEKEAHFRIWYCNLDSDVKVMEQLKVEYPIPYSPKTITYDGQKYLYVYWNKYNIWRFNLKGLINGETTQPWYRLPPNPTLTTLDDNKYLSSRIVNEKYMLVYDHVGGKVFKMDIDTFAWFVDRASEIKNPINSETMYKEVVVFDSDNTLYKIWLGQISGKYYDIYYKQCDNFFFDLRYLDEVVRQFDDLVFDMGMWGVYVKRNRLYIFNHLGHLHYAWVKIYGEFDVEYQLHDFFNADHIRIYTDYTGLEQKDNFKVKVFTINHGWIEIPSSDYILIIEDNNWYWDAEYTRRYKKEVILPHGEIGYQYTKCPPNYVKVPLSSAFNEPISYVRVYFKPEPKEYDYIVRINKVEAIDAVKEVNVYEDGTYSSPINIIHLQPITSDENESQIYVVWIRNDGTSTLSNVKTFLPDNDTKKKWLAFSLDQNQWKFASPSDPLFLTSSLSPGETMYFYIKGINIDDNPKVGEIVITGYEPI